MKKIILKILSMSVLFVLIFMVSFPVINYATTNVESDMAKEESDENKTGLLSKLSNIKLNYILIIAISIAVGELGDKTFLAAIGLGIQYAKYKIPLVIGAIMGMVTSDLLAIILGKIISKKIPEELMKKISGILFIIFGIIGILF